MLFKPEHIKMIEDGIKTVTRRLWKTPYAKVGGTYAVQIKMYQLRKDCPIIKATKVYRQPLGKMTEEDAQKEGGYTLEQFKARFEEITKKPWDPDVVPYVVEFEHLKEVIS